MERLNTLLLLAIVGLMAMFVLTSKGMEVMNPLGSVSVSDEYTATTTGPSSGMANLQLLKSASGVLGSIVITGQTTGEIFVFNATTSDNNLRKDVATSTITLASIPLNIATGTYTFDVVADIGLLLYMTGTQPTSTITFR